MKRMFSVLLVAMFILVSSCSRKPRNIYELLAGDWRLVESNVNGFITEYPSSGQDITMAFYTCRFKKNEWCDANIFYTLPYPINNAFRYKISDDERKLIRDDGVEFEIMQLDYDWLVTRDSSLGSVTIDVWQRF